MASGEETQLAFTKAIFSKRDAPEELTNEDAPWALAKMQIIEGRHLFLLLFR